jgi:carboxyl-terminal processing protease
MLRNLVFVASCVALLGATGNGAHAAQSPRLSRVALHADFKEFVQDFTDNYAWLDRTEKPWIGWPARFEQAFVAAKTPEARAGVLESALDELHDFHAEVRAHNPHRWLPVPTFADMWAEPDGDEAVVIAVRHGSDAERAGIVAGDRITAIGGVPVPAAIAARLTAAVDNDDAARGWALLSLLSGRSDEARVIAYRDSKGASHTATLPRLRQFDRPATLVSVRTLPDNVGLIRLNNSLGEQKTVAAFDAALEQLRGTRGLVLDLRDVPSGGDSSVALGIMGRFVRSMLPYQHHRIPNYGQPDVERNWFEQVAPRGPFTYDAPVVVLVDHWTGSMGEGMAAGMDGMQRAVVIGTPMAHLAGAVSDFKLTHTGIDVAFATEQLFHVNGTLRQDWVPPILVAPVFGPGDSDQDPILERGLLELKGAR